MKKFSTRFKELLIDLVANSFDERLCNKLGSKLEPLFNIHKISGISEKITLQPLTMAQNLVDYFFSKNQQINLLNEIIKAALNGIDGYQVTIYNLNNIIKELEKMGYFFDKNLKQLVYKDEEKKLNDWGVLENNKEYSFCFVSVDIVKNSKITRENNPWIIKETYKTFYNFINEKILARNGRIWLWEGDGGLISFFGDDAINKAVFATLDFYLSLPVFNAVFNKINRVIIPRIAIHYGKAEYKNNINSIQSEDIDFTKEIEKKFALAGEIIISNVVFISLNSNLKILFKPCEKSYPFELYKLNFEVGKIIK